jgi:hypothetical protein
MNRCGLLRTRWCTLGLFLWGFTILTEEQFSSQWNSNSVELVISSAEVRDLDILQAWLFVSWQRSEVALRVIEYSWLAAGWRHWPWAFSRLDLTCCLHARSFHRPVTRKVTHSYVTHELVSLGPNSSVRATPEFFPFVVFVIIFSSLLDFCGI